MIGPEHYLEAEQILAEAKDADSDADRADIELYLRFAEVHATLALAAATADAGGLVKNEQLTGLTPWAKAVR